MPTDKNDYDVLARLKFDGEYFSPDDDDANIVSMADKDATPLLGLTPPVIALRAATMANKTDVNLSGIVIPESRPETDAEVIAAIRSVIQLFDPETKALFAKDGVTPHVKAIENVLQWDGGITAAERNAAMETA